MANTSSAKKQARQNEKRRVKNLTRGSAMKTSVKKLTSAIEAKNVSAQDLKKMLSDSQAKLSRAALKGLIHKKTAQRKISRMAKRIALMEKQA